MIRKTLIALVLGISTSLFAGTAARAQQAAPTQAQMEAPKVLGNKDAKVTIEVYESFACPHCASFHNETLDALKKKYVDTGKVKLVFFEYPGHPRALYPAMMARCAGDDAYHGIAAVMYKNQNTWLPAEPKEFFNAIKTYGKLAGMTDAQFDTCMKNRALFEAMRKQWMEGVNKHGVQSTPTFIINGKQKIVGAQPLKDFEAVIDPMIN